MIRTRVAEHTVGYVSGMGEGVLSVTVERFPSNGSGEVRWCDTNGSAGCKWFTSWRNAAAFGFGLANAGDVRYVNPSLPCTGVVADPDAHASWLRAMGLVAS